MPTSSPPIAGPPYEDVAGRTERLARALSPWQPLEGEPDLGRALIQVFDRMARHVLERLNRVPDRDFLAYLNLIGVEPAPPRPARVPLTFSLVERGTAEPTVPAGTRVGATPAPEDTRAIVFETERELATTRTRLMAAFIRDPDGDRWADCTAQATGAAPGVYEAFTGTQPVEHAFFLTVDDLSNVPVGAVFTATFTFDSQPERDVWSQLHNKDALPTLAGDAYYKKHPPVAPLVRWSYWNGARWWPLEADLTESGATEWKLAFNVPPDLAAVSIRGRTARWLRAELTAWPPSIPEVKSLTLTAKVKSPALAPDLALANARPVDLSMDFQPLGERPRLNDTFYVASDAALSRPGATVTVTVTPSPQAAPQLKTQDLPTLIWELSTDKGWEELVRTSATGEAPRPNDALPSTTEFKLPKGVAPAVVHGKRAHWLRIRLFSGDFGKGPRIVGEKVVDEGFQPPVLAGLTLTVDAPEIVTSTPAPVRRGDFAFTELPPRELFRPFVRDTTAAPVLYLGFHQPFANRETPLYIQVAPLTADEARREVDPEELPPRLVWEYATAAGWAPLGAEDETRAFSRSGLVRFLGPGDFAARTEFGESLYWFRARLDAGTFAVMPRLGRVLTNTVWARHAATLTGEVLGSSDGGTAQVFTLSQRPVLVGQCMEVREPEEPSGAERVELERVEGKDAIQVTRAPGQPAEIWVRWHEVPDFHASGPADRHYTLDRQTGEVRFGDGRYGKVPPRGVRNVRAALYRTGGGTDGNRPVGAVSQLKTTVAYVDAVTNLEPATGGADRESVEQARTRGPRLLRHGGRAVTAEDFEDLAREASPAVARVKALTASFDPIDLAETPAPLPGVTNLVVLIVPFSPELPPVPSAGLLQDVRAYLEARCAPALSPRVVGPDWLQVSTTVSLVPTSFEGAEALRARVQRALTDFLHPLTGGFEGTGWELGELPQESDLYRLVAGLPGVESVRTASLLSTKPKRPERTLIYPGTHTVDIVSREAA